MNEYPTWGVPSDERWDDFVDLVRDIREYQTNAERVPHEKRVNSI